MSKSLILSVLALALPFAAQAEMVAPDQLVTVAICHENNHLPNGLSVVIRSGGFAGLTTATITDRINIGPVETLETIVVRRKPVPAHVMGAGITYLGKQFSLHINTDGAPLDGGFYSEVYADVKGHVYNQPLVCILPAQALAQ
jgi:hypothetical protein